MDKNDLIAVIKDLKDNTKAKYPIDISLLRQIPHFESIFPYEELWSVLVRLSGSDGVAYIEQKTFAEGEKLISKGMFDQMIYWILEGQVNIVSEINKQPKIIHKAKKGECIGALGVLKGAVRTADVVAAAGGVRVIELDWAITERSSFLGKDFHHLIALHLADCLDNAYGTHLKIIANSIKILHDKTLSLIDQNRKLQGKLLENDMTFQSDPQIEQEQAVSHAISRIKESLSLLEIQESKNNLDMFG